MVAICDFLSAYTRSNQITEFILKLTRNEGLGKTKTEEKCKMPQPPMFSSILISALCDDGKLAIRAFYLNIPDIFPPASCWGFGSCDSVLLSSLQNVEKNNWIKID